MVSQLTLRAVLTQGPPAPPAVGHSLLPWAFCLHSADPCLGSNLLQPCPFFMKGLIPTTQLNLSFKRRCLLVNTSSMVQDLEKSAFWA